MTVAGVLKVDIIPEVQGPLASGEAQRALDDWADATAQRLAREGMAMLRSFPMDKTGRATGAFQASLRVMERGTGVRAIPGPMIRGVTWSPWLEGTTSRNVSTRFKGYHLFRSAAQALRAMSERVGEEELAKVMPRIGGGP